MTTLSTRYVGPLLTLLLSAFFAVWTYSCAGFRSDDCADSSALLETGWIEGLELSDEPDGKLRPWLFQDIGGRVATKDPKITPLGFQILRSFELERLYERPVWLFPRGHGFASSEPTLEWIGSQGEELPIYKVFEEVPGVARLGAYMFLYDSRPMANPSLELLSATLRRAVSGRRPLTLVTVDVSFSNSRREMAEELAEKWLISAWEYYRSVCRQ
jgi:hypothetical protein